MNFDKFFKAVSYAGVLVAFVPFFPFWLASGILPIVFICYLIERRRSDAPKTEVSSGGKEEGRRKWICG